MSKHKPTQRKRAPLPSTDELFRRFEVATTIAAIIGKETEFIGSQDDDIFQNFGFEYTNDVHLYIDFEDEIFGILKEHCDAYISDEIRRQLEYVALKYDLNFDIRCKTCAAQAEDEDDEDQPLADGHENCPNVH